MGKKQSNPIPPGAVKPPPPPPPPPPPTGQIIREGEDPRKARKKRKGS